MRSVCFGLMLFVGALIRAGSGLAQCPFSIAIESEAPTACGAADGYIDVTPTSGMPPFTYAWSNGSTSANLSALPAERYTVIITDNASCVHYDTVDLTVAPIVSITTLQAISCFEAATGSLKASGRCGLRNSTGRYYQYQWYKVNGGTAVLLPAQVDSIAAGLDAGSYYAVITDQHSSTATTATVTLTQPTRIVPSAVVTNVSCSGNTNGAAAISATGGTPGYTYAVDAGAYTGSGTFSGLAAGTYTFHVKDAAGCIRDTTIIVTAPTALGIVAEVEEPSGSGSCDGNIDITPNGGTPPFSFSWSNGATTEDINALCAGRYIVITTDANNCSRRDTFDLLAPLTVTVAQQHAVLCNGGIDGALVAHAAGGLRYTSGMPYQYRWYKIIGGTPALLPAQTDSVATGLNAGQYYAVITDANNSNVTSATFTLTEPTILRVAAAVVSILCNGGTGSVTITGTGGTPGYTFARDAGLYAASGTFAALPQGTYVFHARDASGCMHDTTITLAQPTRIVPAATRTNPNCNGSSNGRVTVSATGGTPAYTFARDAGLYTASGVFNGLPAGSYVFHVKDANGCIRDTTIIVSQPTVVSVTASVTGIICNGGTGTITIAAGGGTPGYTYARGTGGYTTLGTFSGLGTGTYVFHARDAAGCIKDTTITLAQPARLTPTAVTTNVTCFGAVNGAVTILAAGGTTPYTYASDASAYTASGSFTGLGAGSYIFHIKDASGCARDTTIAVTQPTRIVPAATIVSTTCYGSADGSVSLTATGGAGGYTFAVDAGAYSAVASFDGLAAGNYVFHIKDAAACARDTIMSVTQPARIVPAVTITNASCNGGNTGAVALSTTGGAGTYTYAMGTGAYTTSGTFGSLFAGTYVFHVKDAAGCIRDTTVSVAQLASLTVVISTTAVSCYGGSDGMVIATVSGGTAPYVYAWSTGAATNAVSGVAAGVYSVTVSDASGCEQQAAAAVTASDSISITPTITDAACSANCNGAIALQLAGGMPAFSYVWSNGATTKDVSTLCGGSYTVTVTDSKGCIKAASFLLSATPAITVNAGADQTICRSGSGVLTAVTSDTGALFFWTSSNGTFSAVTATVTVSQPGSYYVLAMLNGCSAQDTVEVSQINVEINAEFVASSQAFRDSLFSIVNITSPEPDSVRWTLPAAPGAIIVSQGKHLAELIFRDTGVYIVSMVAHIGQCEKTVEDKIIVIEGQPYAPIDGNPHRAYIKEYQIAPNPTGGNFNVHIELDEEGPVRLRVISLSNGGVQDHRQEAGKKIYDIAYNLSVPPGQYLLLLETARGSQSLKLIIQ